MLLDVTGQPAYVYTGTRPLNPDAATVVFAHGAGMDHTVWLLQSRYFAHHRYNVLAVDLPGHGRSAGEPLATIEAQADWLAALLDAAGLQRAALVGHSMGALAVLEAAARHAERVTALALLGVAVPMPVGPALLDAARADSSAAVEMITLWGFAPASHLGGNRVPGLWLAGGGRRLLERAGPGVLFTDLSACNNYRSGLDSAARVRCPSLLLLGQRDLMTPPRNARELADALPDARSLVLPGCGHMMSVERPEETLDALRGFLPA